MAGDAVGSVKLLTFDVFGTVVDWYGSVTRELEAMQLGIDADRFALDWRGGYFPAMEQVTSGERGWATIDELHRELLDDLLERFQVSLSEPEKKHLNKVWHRLDAWPDAVAGLARLKSRYTVCTLSNGNIGLLANMGKHAGLPWDCILSGENFKKYKPDPGVYLGAAEVFDLRPEEVMMVAAHHFDLDGARVCGLKTAYIERPREFGPTQPKDISPHPDNTLHAGSITHLAELLGC